MSLLSKQVNEKKEDVCSNVVQSIGICCSSTIDYEKWIIDSGASDHICYNHPLFPNCKTLIMSNPSVMIPNGDQIKVNIIGDTRIHNDIILKNVLYVPYF